VANANLYVSVSVQEFYLIVRVACSTLLPWKDTLRGSFCEEIITMFLGLPFSSPFYPAPWRTCQ
jgi:hypothetical protein